MIRELTVYKCKCEKCGHEWATKEYVVPIRCAKCNSVKWNEGCAPAPYVAEAIPAEIVAVESPAQTQLTRLEVARAAMASVGQPKAVEAYVEPVEEWKFTKEPVWYDDTNTPYRRQWMGVDKPVYRVVEVGEDDYERVERVKG